MNKWFMIENVGRFNGTPFAFFTSTNDSYVKFDILDLEYRLGCCLQWFSYGWRRREGENISYIYSYQEIKVDINKIFSLRIFQTEEKDIFKKAKIIDQQIANNVEIKQALIERYAKKLGEPIYQTQTNIVIKNARFCDIKDIGVKRLFGDINDDFSSISDLRKCIITGY